MKSTTPSWFDVDADVDAAVGPLVRGVGVPRAVAVHIDRRVVPDRLGRREATAPTGARGPVVPNTSVAGTTPKLCVGVPGSSVPSSRGASPNAPVPPTAIGSGRRPLPNADDDRAHHAHHAGLADPHLDRALLAGAAVDLGVEQLPLVGIEPVAGQRRLGVGPQRRLERPGRPSAAPAPRRSHSFGTPHDRVRQSSSGMGTGCGRGRHVPQWSASSTTRPSVRLRAVLRCTSNRYGPKRAWSSQTPRPQNRHVPRAAFAQNQQSTEDSPISGEAVSMNAIRLPVTSDGLASVCLPRPMSFAVAIEVRRSSQ